MILNYFPVKIEFDKYQLLADTYTENRLTELRLQYNSTHSFFRHGDLIYISNKEGDDINIGEWREVSTYGNSEITSSLIKHLFFRSFKDRFHNYIPTEFYPFRFFSKKASDDLILEALPNDLKNKIAYKKLIEVQLRLTNIGDFPQFGFLINSKRNWIFTKTCAELYAEGFDLKGLEIVHSEMLPGLQNILAPSEEYLGKFIRIEEDKAVVESNFGTVNLPLQELFLLKTKANISKYLTAVTSQTECEKIFSIIETKRSEIYKAKNSFNEILTIAGTLFTNTEERGRKSPVIFHNKDGFCFTVDSMPYNFTNSMELKMPSFIYDYAATKVHPGNPDVGLSNYGPYDSINFDIKSPSFLCLCHTNNRGKFSTFLAELKDGIPQSTYFKKGLIKKYDLRTANFNIKEIHSYALQEYLRVLKENDDKKPDMAIIEISSDCRNLNDKENPYYHVKAKLLALEIPVQFVTSVKILNYNEYILNTIALQIYAKLGGTPWVLPSIRSVDREIIIGIGNSWLRANQSHGVKLDRVVGITTFFSSDGQYLYGGKAKDVPYEEYFSELLSCLKQSIGYLAKEEGWNQGDTIRLIFHIFKPIKNTEYDVVTQLIKEITDYKIQFAFVTIGSEHPFQLYDQSQRGISDGYKNAVTKGEGVPIRGSNLFLDSSTCIVQMLGAKELKSNRHGMSKPIQIKIRIPQGNQDYREVDKYLFSDLSYIVQQIFSFTYLSWRSFLPGEQPASILYANLISKLLGKMRNIPLWDPDRLNYMLKRKKWFL
jgi:hypothetical protein